MSVSRRRLRSVVFGGAGFVGSHLVDRLLEEDGTVVVVDNYVTGRPENLAHQAGNPRLSVVVADICRPLEIEGDLAEKWESPDTQTVVLTLRQGVKWQNKEAVAGRAFTADDAKNGILRIGTDKPEFQRATFFKGIQSIEISRIPGFLDLANDSFVFFG